MIATLADTLGRSVPFLPGPFRAANAALFRPDLRERLAARLLEVRANGVPPGRPPPQFAEEVTLPLGPVFEAFRPVFAEWLAGADGEGHLRKWADAVAAVGCGGVLLLLGQRRTPASLTDAAAIPPTREALLAAADAPCNPGGVLTVVGRAWAKHAPRSVERFWGTVTGGDREKSTAARALLDAILDGATWWNVFGHYKHGTVFEARLSSGHGARWGHTGDPFIGFLEPFA